MMSVEERLRGVPHVLNSIMEAALAAGGEIAEGSSGIDHPAMTHAWLFTGPPGSGRSIAALSLAAALECTNSEHPGCGKCDACRAVFNDSHTDVIHIVPEELIISVGQVRDIVDTAATMPTVGRWRVIIVEDADRLNEQASNALLKTVEEPPEHTVIILCAPSTDPADFSVTLRSRCRHVYVPTPSVAEVTRLLVAEGASQNDAALAAVTSWMHIGRARRLIASQEAQQRRAQILGLGEAIFQGHEAFRAVGGLVAAAKAEAEESHAEADAEERRKLEVALGVGAKGRGTAKALRGSATQLNDLEKRQKRQATRRMRDIFDLELMDLAGLYRDALMVSAGAQVQLVHPDFQPLSEELAARVSQKGLLDCLDAIAACREAFAQNVAPMIAFDALVGKLRIACGVE